MLSEARIFQLEDTPDEAGAPASALPPVYKCVKGAISLYSGNSGHTKRRYPQDNTHLATMLGAGGGRLLVRWSFYIRFLILDGRLLLNCRTPT